MRRRANNSRGGDRDTKSCYLTFRGVKFQISDSLKVFWAKGHNLCILNQHSFLLSRHQAKKVSGNLTLKLKWLYGPSVLVTMLCALSWCFQNKPSPVAFCGNYSCPCDVYLKSVKFPVLEKCRWHFASATSTSQGPPWTSKHTIAIKISFPWVKTIRSNYRIQGYTTS